MHLDRINEKSHVLQQFSGDQTQIDPVKIRELNEG